MTSLPQSLVGQEDEPDIIRIVSLYRTLTLDPIKSVFTGSIEAFGQLYTRLLRADENDELVPGLALRWEVSPDATDYTFFLREAKFSNGSPITADDVAFSLLRMRDDPEAAYSEIVEDMQNAWATDDHTLRVRFNSPNVPFLAGLEMAFLGIVSRADVERRGSIEAFADVPVTSGPYRVVEWLRNDRLILEANPYYWREGYPLNDGAELIEVVDVNTRISMLQSGEVDAVRFILNSHIADLTEDPDVVVPIEPALRVSILLLNHDKPPFDDKRLRQAAALALDMERITEVMFRGRGRTANTLLPEQLNFYDPDFPGWEYDPERARQLIKDAGAVGTDVTINITAPDADWEMAALIVQSYWGEVGLNVIIQKMDQALYEQRLVDGDYDSSVEWWYNESTEPDLAVRWALCGGCGNRSYYTNYQSDRVDELVDLGTAETDPDKRREIYREIQAIAFRDVAQIPLYYSPWPNAYSTSIEGLRLRPSTQWTLEETRRVR
jgi:peptide/nickel transport system substrate-binding protein